MLHDVVEWDNLDSSRQPIDAHFVANPDRLSEMTPPHDIPEEKKRIVAPSG